MGEYLTIRKSSYLFSLTQFQKISHIKTFKLPIEPKLKYPNFKFSGDFSRFHQQMNIRCRRGYAICNSEFIGQGRRRGRNKQEKYVDRIMFMIPIKKQLFEGVLKNNVSEKKIQQNICAGVSSSQGSGLEQEGDSSRGIFPSILQ